MRYLDIQIPIVFNPDSIEELIHQLSNLHPESADIIRIIPSGDNFSYGADLKWYKSSSHESRITFFKQMKKLCSAILGCPVPIVAVSKGYCIGSGAIVALFCDLIVAYNDKAFFSFPELKQGIPIPEFLSRLLVRRVGDYNCLSIMTGRSINALAALDMGLIDEVLSLNKEGPKETKKDEHIYNTGNNSDTELIPKELERFLSKLAFDQHPRDLVKESMINFRRKKIKLVEVFEQDIRKLQDGKYMV